MKTSNCLQKGETALKTTKPDPPPKKQKEVARHHACIKRRKTKHEWKK
jgi:hypothetical protein